MNRRHGDSISRQKDNARTEARALRCSSLLLEVVTTSGGSVVQAVTPHPVHAYVEVGVTMIRAAGHAVAWNSRCVLVRWAGTNPEPQEAWVWAGLRRHPRQLTPGPV